MTKITYRACFHHCRVYNPRILHWQPMFEGFQTHFEIHLIATPCDECEKGDANAQNKKSQDLAATPAPRE